MSPAWHHKANSGAKCVTSLLAESGRPESIQHLLATFAKLTLTVNCSVDAVSQCKRMCFLPMWRARAAVLIFLGAIGANTRTHHQSEGTSVRAAMTLQNC